MRSVFFYSDADEYGGHEAMTLEAARHLSQDPEIKVSFGFYEGNERLRRRIEEPQASAGVITPVPLKWKSQSLQALRSLVSWRKIGRLKALMEKLEPDMVIVSQGRIEGSSMGLLAGKRAEIRTISYLPMAHPLAISGKRVAIGIRERINSHFYRLPDDIITISDSARRMLQARGLTQNIAVVPNGITLHPIGEGDRQRFRSAHWIEANDYLIAVIGRIQFKQKGQDFALQTIASYRSELAKYKFMFIGDGPDGDALREMVADNKLTDMVKILPWTPNPTEVYAGIDMLMIPSRFEGVPLVMLEAMGHGLPIVATNVDGMLDLLPRDWLFSFGDGRGLIETVLRLRSRDISEVLESHRNRICHEFTMTNFGRRFKAAIC
jgi:glycosyltransferase involved in cell wall biosynthesis